MYKLIPKNKVNCKNDNKSFLKDPSIKLAEFFNGEVIKSESKYF